MSLRRVGLSNSLSSQAKVSNKRLTLSRVSLRRFPFPMAAAATSAVYIEDVFGSYLYTGNNVAQIVYNNFQLGGLPTNGTILHLTGDTLTDSAPSPCSIINSNISVNTTVKKYGSGSLRFQDNTKDINAYSPDLKFGTSDFTVECWVQLTDSYNQGIFQLGGNFLSTGGCVFVAQYLDSFNWGWNGSYSTSGTFSTGQWYHIALVRQANELKLYVNGTQNGPTRTYSGNITDGVCRVGGYYDNGYSIYGGYIDDFRVSNKAVYTSNFTPPTGPLSIDTLINGTKKGGLVWLKRRNTTSYSHYLFDTERGVSQSLSSDTTGASTNQSSNGVSNFAATGFTITRNQQEFNNSAGNYVSWIFRKQPKFFDIVTYTGNGSTQTINHNLGSIPGCIIVKTTSTDSTYGWCVFHRSTGSNNLRLNSNEAAGSTFTGDISNVTSSSFNVSSQIDVNFDGRTYVAYIFAHDAGGFGLTGTDNVISCGSFTYSAGTEVNLGYEPQWILVKRTDDPAAGNWLIVDTMRNWTTDGNASWLIANASSQESSGSLGVALTSTGFRVPTGFGNGSPYIYIAIRRGPMKTPTSGTSVFNTSLWIGNNSTQNIIGLGFPADVFIGTTRNFQYGFFYDRLRGSNQFLRLNSTGTETTTSAGQDLTAFLQDGFSLGTPFQTALNNNATDAVMWNFRRAPGFLDAVCYTGTGSARTVTHNLGVTPELMIVKSRSSLDFTAVYNVYNGATQYMRFDATSASTGGGSSYWNNTAPTSSVFSVGSIGATNESSRLYVAYLFASCPGVSKVGSYTGTGTTQQINCTDSTGAWYVWDTARGIVSGNDPYLLLNDTAAEVTNTDFIDPYNLGFEISSTAPAAINANGGTYIFLAIA
jgi:hypothetical protein